MPLPTDEAFEDLRKDPKLADQFKEHYGFLPAPMDAVQDLDANPGRAPEFKQHYGYLPAPQKAIDDLKADPSLSQQFADHYGYLPDSAPPTMGERFNAGLRDATSAAIRMARLIPTVTMEVASRAQGKRIVPGHIITISAEGKYIIQPEHVVDDYTLLERILPGGKPPSRRYKVARGEEVAQPEFLPGLYDSAKEVSDAMDGTIANIQKDLPEAVKQARSGPIVTKDKDGKLDVHWKNINLDVMAQLAADSMTFGGGLFKLAKVLGGGAVAAGSANSILISAETVHDTRQMMMAKLEKQGIKGEEAEVLANAATTRALEIIGPTAFVTGKFGEGAAIKTASLRQLPGVMGKNAATETVEQVVQDATPAAATGSKQKPEQLLAGAILAPAAGAGHAGTIGVAEVWTNSLKESLPEVTTEAQKADTGNPASGEERRAQPTEGPRERRQGENEAKRQETEDVLQQYRATQQAVKDGTATQADLDKITERALTLLYTDELTGLQNFRAYQKYVADHPDHAIAKLDLDGFKELNDKYGHEGADGILRAVGAVLSRMGKEMNVLPFRISTSGKGDEFAVMGPDPAVLKTFGKAVQDELDSTTLDITNEKGEQVTHPSIGVSYGVASNPGAAETALKADKAARKASGKRQGLRDTPVEGAPDMAASAGVPAGEPAGGGAQAANDTQAAAPGVVEGAATDSAPVTSEQIQAAKPNLPAEERPSSTAYSGLALDRMGEHIANAARRLMDKLGIAKEGVEVEKSGDSEAQPGPMSLIWSPSKLVKKYPKLAKYLNFARGAFETQEGLRNAFRTRLKKIDDILKEGDIFGSLSDTYRKNKRTLKEIRLTEDALGKSLTAQQMKDDFGASPAVIKAHMMMRATYNHAWTILSKTRELRGKLPPSFREGYLPHMFHNYFVIQEHPLPPGAAGPPHSEIVGSGRTIAEAVALGNQFKRLGGTGNIKIRQKHFKFPGEDVQAAVVGDIEYFQMQRKLEKDFELTHEEAQEMMDALAHRKGRSRFFGNLLERKGVKGWEQDLDWVDRRYFNMVARYAALDRFKKSSMDSYETDFGKFDTDKRGLAKFVKDYINDVNGTPTYVEELLNNGLKNGLPWLHKFLGHYLGDRPILQLANGWANATAIAKLGFLNPASALINSTQLLGAYSVLGEKHFMVGNGLAMKALSGKGKDASTLRGILKQAGVDSDLSLSSAAGYSSNAPLGKLLNMTMFAFTSMEKYVRATTVLGAYRKAVAGGASHKEAIEFAKGVNERVNFNYGVIDAPNFIRRSGPAGTIAFQFKKFPVKMMEFMLSQNPKEMARFWIPMFLIAGMYAIPGGEALKELIKAASSKNGYGGWDAELELKRWLMKWAGDDPEKQRWANVVMYGAFSNAGVDISRRVGGSDFIPTRPSDFVGAGPSSLWRAVQYGMQGDWAEALRSVATSPGNVAVALSQNGKFSRSADNRDRPSAKASPGDIAKKALGFRPYEESKENDVARIIAYENERYRRTQNEIVDGIIESTLRYNETVAALDQQAPPATREPLKKEAKEEYDREIADIVKAIAKNGIVVTPDQVLNEIKNKNLTPSQRAFLNASDVIKARNSRVYMFANGSFGHED